MASTKDKIVQPSTAELAGAEKASQYGTRGFASTLVAPNDTVLAKRGGTYGIYEDLLRDDQVRSTFQQRRYSVTQAEWHVEAGASDAQSKAAATFLEEQINNLVWDDVIDKMLYGVFYGYAVAEMMWAREGSRIVIPEIKVRDRKRFLFDIDHELWLADNPTQPVKMPDRKFWFMSTGGDHSDNPYGLGLAHSLYWLVYFKRNDVQLWLTALEKFGAPTVVGKAPYAKLQDRTYSDRLHEMLSRVHTDSTMTIPEDAEIELLEAFRKGAADYESLQHSMDAAISKVTVGQTMTTDPGSSRAQAEVHMDVREDITKADADLVHESFMRGPARWLTEWNFPGATTPIVYRDVEPAEDLNSRAERDQKVYQMGFEPTEEYIAETYGEGWVKREMQGPLRMPGAEGEDPDGAGPAFAEMVDLVSERNGRRSDQEALKAAAKKFSRNYRGLLGKRVEQLVEYAESTGDLEEFQQQLTAMLAEDPPEEAVRRLERGGVFARLMGALRTQRRT